MKTLGSGRGRVYGQTNFNGNAAADNGVEGLLGDKGKGKRNGGDYEQRVLCPPPVVLNCSIGTDNRAILVSCQMIHNNRAEDVRTQALGRRSPLGPQWR
jgi:hypothetical protein